MEKVICGELNYYDKKLLETKLKEMKSLIEK